MLTGLIAESGAKLYSFEIDTDLVYELESKFKDNPNVNIANFDFLIVEPYEGRHAGIKLIGNIPYDITSPIVDWITRHDKFIKRAVITAQKELGDRISSGPGSKNWAPISIFAQCFFNIRSMFTIPPGAFYPKPKVHSATLLFEPRDPYIIEDWDFLSRWSGNRLKTAGSYWLIILLDLKIWRKAASRRFFRRPVYLSCHVQSRSRSISSLKLRG